MTSFAFCRRSRDYHCFTLCALVSSTTTNHQPPFLRTLFLFEWIKMPLRQRQRSDDEKEAEEEEHFNKHQQYDDKAAKTTALAATIQATLRMHRCLLLLLVFGGTVILAAVFFFLHPPVQQYGSSTYTVNYYNDNDDMIVIRCNLSREATLHLYLRKNNVNAQQSLSHSPKGGEGGGGEKAAGGEHDNNNNNNNNMIISSLGPHKVKLVILNNASLCNKTLSPRFVIRLLGDALVHVHLQEKQQHQQEEDSSSSTWIGSFTLPIVGSYMMDAKWYGCCQSSGAAAATTKETTTYKYTSSSQYLPLAHASILIQAAIMDNDDESKKSTTTATATADIVDSSSSSSLNDDDDDDDNSIFTPTAAWLSMIDYDHVPATKKHQQQLLQQSYIWTDPNRLNTLLQQPSSSLIEIKNALVSKHGTARSIEGFYEFANLGNYELLCFIGGKSMTNIHGKFLELRPYIAPNQRPFKFHIYEMTSFTHPDEDWTDENKKRLRKCKHMLVSLQDFHNETSTSQTQYKEQLTIFVRHLLNVMNDDTFPIRLFTWTSPRISNNNRCNEDRFLPRTTDHPCNDVIKHLFAKQGSAAAVFPERVKLLDNTDLSLPWAFQLEEEQEDENQNHPNNHHHIEEVILANIALRIFVVAGKQVADWRAMGQHGKVDGLHRNGKIEPNFELVPYTGWSNN